MPPKFILAIDEGTTWVKVVVLDRGGRQVAFGSAETELLHPREGRVEQDPLQLWRITYDLIQRTLSDQDLTPRDLAAIGITNQRETTLFWNRKTGLPYGNAVVWLDKRASPLVEQFHATMGPQVVDRLGMIVIPNAAALLVKWLVDHDPAIGEAVERGEACFGTVNSWLLWQLTGGEVHCSDLANMSITLLQNARTLDYDEEVLQAWRIPRNILPELKGTGEITGWTAPHLFAGERIPIAGMLGDQMAAALGQGCVEPGMVKNTYGTGSFAVMNVGPRYVPPTGGLFASFLWGTADDRTYSLEGYSEICGAAIDWLKNDLKLVKTAEQTEELARAARGPGPLYFVPALTGLGTPHLDTTARGLLWGLTTETKTADLVKAVLEGIAYQATDLITCMERATGERIRTLRVDGGLAQNNYVCQFQADLLGRPVERPRTTESTVLGAAYQAGLTAEFWHSPAEVATLWQLDRRFEPQIAERERHSLYSGWLEAVERSKGWIGKSCP
jgi:glycerol kinase